MMHAAQHDWVSEEITAYGTGEILAETRSLGLPHTTAAAAARHGWRTAGV